MGNLCFNMDYDKQELLFNRFKFYNRNKSLQESLMGFGFECGSGWFNLLWELSLNIEKELEKDLSVKDSFEVYQVKEKYGELCFYCGGYNDAIDKLVVDCEVKSLDVCEICGNKGENDIEGGTIYTLCDKHWSVLRK